MDKLSDEAKDNHVVDIGKQICAEDSDGKTHFIIFISLVN